MVGFAILILIFAGICLWQTLAGFSQMRRAKANPDDPRSVLLYRFGRIKALLGGGLLVVNIVLNLPALRVVL